VRRRGSGRGHRAAGATNASAWRLHPLPPRGLPAPSPSPHAAGTLSVLSLAQHGGHFARFRVSPDAPGVVKNLCYLETHLKTLQFAPNASVLVHQPNCFRQKKKHPLADILKTSR
ncbi:MAG: hypothetical protein BJ554DRAFT_3167, partial [Olpidium bornovanus]